MIRILKIFTAILILLMLALPSYGQDRRTTETKIADLLARMPAGDLQLNDKLMGDMVLLGEAGLKQICEMVIPAGAGEDIKPRFAIASLSRFLSAKGKESYKAIWEKICISYATTCKDPGVVDFFLKQLQLIGGEQSVEAMKAYLTWEIGLVDDIVRDGTVNFGVGAH